MLVYQRVPHWCTRNPSQLRENRNRPSTNVSPAIASVLQLLRVSRQGPASFYNFIDDLKVYPEWSRPSRPTKQGHQKSWFYPFLSCVFLISRISKLYVLFLSLVLTNPWHQLIILALSRCRISIRVSTWFPIFEPSSPSDFNTSNPT